MAAVMSGAGLVVILGWQFSALGLGGSNSADADGPEVAGSASEVGEVPVTAGSVPDASGSAAAARPSSGPVSPGGTASTAHHASTFELGVATGYRILSLSEIELDQQLELYADMGISWVRIDFDWGRIERVRGQHDWSAPDRVVDAVRAHGMKVLPCISFAPYWASGSTDSRVPPKLNADYANFAALAAGRYASKGIDSWQIWNEANLRDFWKPYPNPTKYAGMLKAASVAIKKANPSAKVIATGLAPVRTTREKGHITALDFLNELYAEGAGSSFDAVGVHPYTYPDLPTDTSRWNAFQGVYSLRDLMVRMGDGGKPIWITEFGAPTGTASNAVSEARQVSILSSGIALARAWSWSGPMMIYGGVDLGTDVSNSEENFGFVKQSLEPKLAYDAIVSELDGDG